MPTDHPIFSRVYSRLGGRRRRGAQRAGRAAARRRRRLRPAVVSPVLCSVQDQAAALAEARRVLRPGGELRFYEHVRSTSPRFARVQRAVDVVWPFFSGGCHTARDTLAAIASDGFEVEAVDRFHFPPTRVPQPASPHVLGRARVAAG